MENQVVFKKASFGGFDKQSVMDYIYEMNNTAQEAQQKLSAQIAELTAVREQQDNALRELEEKNRSAQRERDSAAAEAKSEKARVAELGVLIETLQDELQQHRDRVADREKEISDLTGSRQSALEQCAALREQNQRLEQKCQELERGNQELEQANDGLKAQVQELGQRLEGLELKNQELEQQNEELKLKSQELERQNNELASADRGVDTATQQELEQAASQIEAMLSRAREQALRIVSEAERKAKARIQQAEEKSRQLLEELAEQAQTVTAETSDSLRDLQDRFQRFKREFADMRAQLNTVVHTAQKQFDDMEQAVSRLDDTLPSGGDPEAGAGPGAEPKPRQGRSQAAYRDDARIPRVPPSSDLGWFARRLGDWFNQ